MKNKRTCDYIAEAIQNEILSGRMEAGMPLRQEELADSLGYSRIPVREALQILETQGLVRRLATRHVVVADFSEKVIDEIFGMICEVETKAWADLAEAGISWSFDSTAEEAEADFHAFLCETVANEFFRRLLETAADCYIRFAAKETAYGRKTAGERKKLLQQMAEAYEKKQAEGMQQKLKEYYDILAECMKRERSAAE